jgi:hypothetical protein
MDVRSYEGRLDIRTFDERDESRILVCKTRLFRLRVYVSDIRYQLNLNVNNGTWLLCVRVRVS